MNDAILRLVQAAGIEQHYWDALGRQHRLEEASARALLAALGVDPEGNVEMQCALLARENEAAAEAGRRSDVPRCFVPTALAEGRRIWGLSIQLYALRSARNWGVGDFTDLAAFARIAANAGAKIVGINPLHARHLACPGRASPYSPSSRMFVDAMSIDVEAVPDFVASAECAQLVAAADFQARLAATRAAPRVDHAAVCALKLPVLQAAFDGFESRHGAVDDPRRIDFERFIELHGAALMRYAEFEAIRLDRARNGLPELDWQQWPDEWRDPQSAAVRAFRTQHGRDIRFLAYLQWEAARQLESASLAARAAGLEFTFYRDLAVGAAKDSAEAWGDPELTVAAVSIGAPPDAFSADGQNWGLPPWNPRVLAAREFAPFTALLAANMSGAGALRIDHVMALTRLFWIPDGMRGADGSYVRQPFEALAAAVARESLRQRCLVVGEDLGSVPEGLREQLQARGFLSYRVLLFERHWQSGGVFKRPDEYPPQALATAMTHDLPTIADYWTFGDIARRAALGLYRDPAAKDAAERERHEDRWKLMALMSECGVLPPDPENTGAIADALHTLVARTPSMIAIVQLDDVLGETEPANIPGTDAQYPNWRRKMSQSLEEIAHDPRLARLTQTMRAAGRG